MAIAELRAEVGIHQPARRVTAGVTDPHTGTVGPAGDVVKKMTVVGEPLRQSRGELMRAAGNHFPWFAACGGNTEQAARVVGDVEDGSVAAPCPARRSEHVRERLRSSTVDAHAL